MRVPRSVGFSPLHASRVFGFQFSVNARRGKHFFCDSPKTENHQSENPRSAPFQLGLKPLIRFISNFKSQISNP
jgi:hypothetical protein